MGRNLQKDRLETTGEALIQRISELEALLIQNIELASTSKTQPNNIPRSPVSQNDFLRPADERAGNSILNLADTSHTAYNIVCPPQVNVGTIVKSSSGHVWYMPHNTTRVPDVFHSLQGESRLNSTPNEFSFDGLLPNKQSLLDLLPPFRHCDDLLAIFNEMFSPLFHILHDATFESNYVLFKQDPKNASLPFMGLLFVVLSLAITAIDKDSAILSDLGREASATASARSLAEKYRQAAMRCLFADNFMWRHNLQTLQCLVLVIYAINHAHGPAWTLLGTTVNVAIAIGCHIDPVLLNLDPIEVQERRRVWAGLMMLYTIQKTCLGNLAPPTVENNVQLPADIEDDDIMSESFHEAMHSTEHLSNRHPLTKMSYLLFKFRLYSLASSISTLSSQESPPSPSKIQALDYQLQTELQAQSARFSNQVDLPIYHQAHSFILNNYTNHLVLILHRICLMKPERFEDAFLKPSYEKCEKAALAIISNYEMLSMLLEFRPYSWYIHGLGSFHAFLAISTLMVLLRKGLNVLTPEHQILQSLRRCLRRFNDNAQHSEICKRAASILDQSIPGVPSQMRSPDQLSNGISSTLENLSTPISDSGRSFDIDIWSLPESFEEIVSKIPCEQWLSPAVFPWTERQ